MYNLKHYNEVCTDHSFKIISIIEKRFCHTLFLSACFQIQRNFTCKTCNFLYYFSWFYSQKSFHLWIQTTQQHSSSSYNCIKNCLHGNVWNLQVGTWEVHVEKINKCNCSKCSNFRKTYLEKMYLTHVPGVSWWHWL